MPIKFIEHTDGGSVGFWEIAESTDQLLAMLSPGSEEMDQFLQLRNDLRKREWLAARLLLKQMTGNRSGIIYDPAGKPLADNFPGHISISHSSNCVVIYHHPDRQPGIDIELITRNVERSARKFLSPEELIDCTIEGQLSNKDIMLRWCAKEAVFKMVPYSNIDFATQIKCSSMRLSSLEGELSAQFLSAETTLDIRLHYRLIGAMLMVWGTI